MMDTKPRLDIESRKLWLHAPLAHYKDGSIDLAASGIRTLGPIRGRVMTGKDSLELVIELLPGSMVSVRSGEHTDMIFSPDDPRDFLICPHCGHQWKRRKERPKVCPKCGLRLSKLPPESYDQWLKAQRTRERLISDHPELVGDLERVHELMDTGEMEKAMEIMDRLQPVMLQAYATIMEAKHD